MTNSARTPAGEALTGMMLDLFRLNSRVLTAGDRLVSDLGLTSARWQVLGAIAYADRPESVAWHARSMGVHRQGIQRIVNELENEGIVEFQNNPHHKRAHLVLMTPKGKKLYEEALILQTSWVNELSSGLKLRDISVTKKVINQLKTSLEEKNEDI